MSVDHVSGVAAPKADPVFLHVKAGMTVIVDDGSDWRMADVIWVEMRRVGQMWGGLRLGGSVPTAGRITLSAIR